MKYPLLQILYNIDFQAFKRNATKVEKQGVAKLIQYALKIDITVELQLKKLLEKLKNKKRRSRRKSKWDKNNIRSNINRKEERIVREKQ